MNHWTQTQVDACNRRRALGKRLVKASDFERRPPASVVPALGSPKPHVATKGQETAPSPLKANSGVLRLVLKGEIRGAGKNNVLVTRTGARIPPQRFREWSRDAQTQIVRQAGKTHYSQDWSMGRTAIFQEGAVLMELDFYPGTRRRIDQTATLDALFHVLEKSGIVADDRQLWLTRSTRTYDKANPRAEITLRAEPDTKAAVRGAANQPAIAAPSDAINPNSLL